MHVYTRLNRILTCHSTVRKERLCCQRCHAVSHHRVTKRVHNDTREHRRGDLETSFSRDVIYVIERRDARGTKCAHNSVTCSHKLHINMRFNLKSQVRISSHGETNQPTLSTPLCLFFLFPAGQPIHYHSSEPCAQICHGRKRHLHFDLILNTIKKEDDLIDSNTRARIEQNALHCRS